MKITPLFLLIILAAITSCEKSKPVTSDKKQIAEPKTPEIAYSSGETSTFDPQASDKLEAHISFGSELPLGMQWENSQIELDQERAIWSSASLAWNWKQGASISFKRPIPWHGRKQARALKKHFHTVETAAVVWIYNETPLPDGKLEFEFYSKDKKVSSFSFGLDFSGWRSAAVSFDSEMQGMPSGPMDQLKIIAPTNVNNGRIWLGDILASKIIDSRHRHGDYQVPYVKKASQLKTGHWDPIMFWYDLGTKAKSDIVVTDEYTKAFKKLRPKQARESAISPNQVKQIEKQFTKYNIRKRSDGSIVGDHLYMLHHLDSAPKKRQQKGHTLKDYTGFMLNVAKKWSQLPEKQKNAEAGSKLAEIFCLMSEHLLDQGFTAGSALVTMHHFGYNARNWAPSVELMQVPLKEKQLLEPMQQALVWYYNCNKIYDPNSAKADMDYLNTLAASDLRILSIGADGKEKAARLVQFSKWISKMLSENTPSNNQGFKPDGSLYHHNMHYFGYGMPALSNTVAKIVAPLDGTPFEISEEAYAALKERFIAASYWNYPHSGFNACGRHPLTSSAKQLKDALRLLAKHKPNTDSTDEELAQVYLNLFGGNAKSLFGKTLTPGPKTTGVIAMNHNASFSLKHAGNTMHVKGFGDGIKDGETYKADNRYGRYLSHGSIQVFKHTLSHTSGNKENGWDWSRIPGTTSLWLPHDILEGSRGFYGAKPKQKSHPSGAGTLNGKFAGFLFQLDKTNDKESLTVRKSVFAFGDTIICLGSDITNNSATYPTVTNLFQVAPQNKSQAPLKHSLDASESWIIDSYGTGYFIPNNQAFKTASEQQASHHNKTRQKTKGFFHTGWIDHGNSPQKASYQYHILLNATPEKMAAWKTSQAQRIKVKQQDSSAHHLVDTLNKIDAYAVFKPTKLQNSDTILSLTNHSCIVLLQHLTSETIKLSHTNINIDDIGKKSAESIITLKGKWEPSANPVDGCKVTIIGETTTLKFSNKMAQTQEIKLKVTQ